MTGFGGLALFHNEPDGRGGRRYAEVTQKAGLHDTLWATSAAWGDLDGDGYPDLYVCHYLDWSFRNNPPCTGQKASVPHDVCAPPVFRAQPHALYRNMGREFFLFSSRAAATFCAPPNPRRQRPVLLRNRGDGTFANVTPQGGPYFRADHLARGAAGGDLDNDGSADLVISHVNEPVVLLRGRAPVTPDGHALHWLGVELAGRGHRDTVGATVRLEAGGRQLVRFAKGGRHLPVVRRPAPALRPGAGGPGGATNRHLALRAGAVLGRAGGGSLLAARRGRAGRARAAPGARPVSPPVRPRS